MRAGVRDVPCLPREAPRAGLDHLFECLAWADGLARAGLVADTRQLTSVYALTSYDPGIAGAVLEIPSVGLAEGLQELSFQEPETAVTYSQPALLALGEDGALLERQGWDVTFDLIRMVDAQCRELRLKGGVRVVEPDHLRNLGGLRGMLRTQLEQGLERLGADEEGNQEIARAILEGVLDARAQGADADFADIAPRLGVSTDRVDRVLKRLTEPQGLLRRLGTGEYRLEPPHLAAIVESDLASRNLQDEKAHRVVED